MDESVDCIVCGRVEPVMMAPDNVVDYLLLTIARVSFGVGW